MIQHVAARLGSTLWAMGVLDEMMSTNPLVEINHVLRVVLRRAHPRNAFCDMGSRISPIAYEPTPIYYWN